MNGLCILGSTGSIGQNCLNVVRSLPGRFRVVALAAGKNLDRLADQIVEFQPQVVSVGRVEGVQSLRDHLRNRGHDRAVHISVGVDGQLEAVTHPEVDTVVSACHGVTGLVATLQALSAGKKLALANKETLVVAGHIVMKLAAERGIEVLPIDSEHCAVHQCLRAGVRSEVKRLILTASGGPFLRTPRKQFVALTPEQALQHPVWRMGGRITIDSATLMNKSLELIEARWLFGLSHDQMDVVIHPESIIHSMIEFRDGSVMAQMSVPDMRLPIQYALTFPERIALNGSALNLNLLTTRRLRFLEPDLHRFPCLELGLEVLRKGGGLPCALNAADEVAVDAFLHHRLRFSEIPKVIEQVMARAPDRCPATLEEVLNCDQEARERAAEVIAAGRKRGE